MSFAFLMRQKKRKNWMKKIYWFYHGWSPPHALSIFTCQMANTSATHATSLLKLQEINYACHNSPRVDCPKRPYCHTSHVSAAGVSILLAPRMWPLACTLFPTFSSASARPSSSSVHDHRRRKSFAQIFDINLQRSYVSTSIAAIRKLENFGS